ncbi:MAG: serine/threonine-protein kinase [bacterium]|nr:serine/threonine protein kinase [Myxococcales bacterium]MCB9550749.1 serine/threonine protein kinase [Myxococcales bacterium]
MPVTAAVTHPPDPLLGRVIADRYQLIERIGEGGMGTVYKARQEPLGKFVAIKVLLPSLIDDDLKLQRFMNEARILGELRHPNTVSLIDFGHIEGGRLFIAMEYLHGGDLASLLAKGRVEQRAALMITRQIVASLAEAHARGVIHRDLKPQNVLFDEVAGEDFVVRVADFGLARFDPLLGQSDELPTGAAAPAVAPGPGEHGGGRKGFRLQPVQTVPGTRLGTPAYISPEQAFARPIDARSDLYSVGVMLYEMLVGHRPFADDTSQGLCLAHLYQEAIPISEVSAPGELDPDVEHLVMRLLAKSPDERPANARVVLKVIDRVLSRMAEFTGPLPSVSLPARPRPVSVVDDEPVVMPRGGPPLWAWAVIVTGALVIIGFALLH